MAFVYPESYTSIKNLTTVQRAVNQGAFEDNNDYKYENTRWKAKNQPSMYYESEAINSDGTRKPGGGYINGIVNDLDPNTMTKLHKGNGIANDFIEVSFFPKNRLESSGFAGNRNKELGFVYTTVNRFVNKALFPFTEEEYYQTLDNTTDPQDYIKLLSIAELCGISFSPLQQELKVSYPGKPMHAPSRYQSTDLIYPLIQYRGFQSGLPDGLPIGIDKYVSYALRLQDLITIMYLNEAFQISMSLGDVKNLNKTIFQGTTLPDTHLANYKVLLNKIENQVNNWIDNQPRIELLMKNDTGVDYKSQGFINLGIPDIIVSGDGTRLKDYLKASAKKARDPLDRILSELSVVTAKEQNVSVAQLRKTYKREISLPGGGTASAYEIQIAGGNGKSSISPLVYVAGAVAAYFAIKG